MATLILTLLLHFGLAEPITNQPSLAPSSTQSTASQAAGGSIGWVDR